MAQRRRNILDLAGGLGVASVHTGITLFYRLPMLAASFTAHGKERHARELDRMVSEKASAMVEGAIDAQREILRVAIAAMMNPLDFLAMAQTPVSIADAALRPAFRRVEANSVRLRKSRRPGPAS
jgi:hypothetical protein